MYTFLVLGFIPGTTFQITFQLWLDAVATVSVALLLVWLLTNHRTVTIVALAPIRIPLDARQLHLQAL